MSWFKRSSRASSANHPHMATPAAAGAVRTPVTTHDLSKSLCSLNEQLIERLEPEEFFHDPVHVRHYKEEALFLSFMAEWEIIEHPQQENFFSADFEEELLHTHTQHTPYTPAPHQPMPNSELNVELQLEQKKLATPTRRRKRKLLELIFVENIEMGLVLPQPGAEQQQQQLEQERAAQQVLCKKSKYASSSLSSLGSNNTTTTATCPQQVLKDCRIDRQQLKTEALAGSIMGAIGKCPNPEQTPAPPSSSSPPPPPLPSPPEDLQLLDPCHPGERNTCDHYDIKQFFHLDDHGNILLNMAHIVECRAAGLALQAQSRRLYRRYLRGCECADEQQCPDHGCCAPLIGLIQLIQRLVSGKQTIETRVLGLVWVLCWD